MLPYNESRPYMRRERHARGVLAKPSAAMAVAVGDLATTRVVVRCARDIPTPLAGGVRWGRARRGEHRDCHGAATAAPRNDNRRRRANGSKSSDFMRISAGWEE